MEIQSIDHIELFVEDAGEAAAGLRDRFGFALAGRGGARTGLRGCESVLLRQEGVTLLLTSPTGPDGRVAEYIARHGDGVGVIALRVGDARAAFAEAVERGAAPVAPPETFGPEGARVAFASVTGFGDVEHRFVSRDRPGGPFAPLIEETGCGRSGWGLVTDVDHIAVRVPAGTLEETVHRHEEIFGLRQTFEERIVAGAQAKDTKIVRSRSGRLTLTFMEPEGRVGAAHDAARVQHIAFLTEDIRPPVSESAGRGVRFLTTPQNHRGKAPFHRGPIDVPVKAPRDPIALN